MKSRATIGKILVKLFENREGQLDSYLLIVFLIVNGLVLFNALFHDPIIQYDGGGHLAYVVTLANLHLPTADESSEFFSPPLPYILPAAAKFVGRSLWWAAKVGQIVNVALSLGITGLLIVLCRSARPSDTGNTALVALMFLGALPVYYKTMAFVRGEPYVAFLTLVAIAVSARALTFDKRSLADAIAPGLCWGLLILARQWGALAAAGLVVTVWLAALRTRDGHKVMIGLVGSLIALLVGGWFFGWLWMSHGSPIAFNRSTGTMQWTFRNQPFDFYFGTGNGRLFADPVRPSFPNQLVPIFYAETWGDYWGYFLIYAKDLASGTYEVGPDLEEAVTKPSAIIETNRFALNKYLGRVNLLALLPTALALVAFGTAAVRLRTFVSHGGPVTLSEIILVMATLVIAVSASGYLWFIVGYPNLGKGDTIKATYMLHVFAPLALLTADFVRRIGVPRRACFVGWGLLMMHNALAVTTHYITVQW
jgi:hypothetical protein